MRRVAQRLMGRDLADARVVSAELGFRFDVSEDGCLNRFESFVASYGADEVARVSFLDLMADFALDERPFPNLRRHLALKVAEELPSASCHLVGNGRSVTPIVKALGWEAPLMDASWKPPARTWMSAANTVGLYANKSFRLLFAAPCNEYGRDFEASCATEAYMLTWGSELLCNPDKRKEHLLMRFDGDGIVPVAERYLSSLERYVRACYSLGNFMPAPDGGANRGKIVNCSDRPDLFWRSLARVASAQSYQRQRWYEDHADALVLAPWFEGGEVRLEGPYRFRLTSLPKHQFWLENPGPAAAAADLDARSAYMDGAAAIVAERSEVLARRLAGSAWDAI